MSNIGCFVPCSLLFAATATMRVPYCGWTNTTDLTSCLPGADPDRCLSCQCHHHDRTRWCTTAQGPAGHLGTGADRSTSLAATLTRHETLQAKTFTDPNPDPLLDWSCTVSSLSRPVEWRLERTGGTPSIFEVNWLPASTTDFAEAELKFSLHNSALEGDWEKGGLVEYIGAQDGVELAPYYPDFQPTHLYGEPGEVGFTDINGWSWQRGRIFPKSNNLAWNVRFDASSGYLELNHSWFCDDRDPSRP